MARKKEEYEKEIIKVIKKENLFTINMIFTYYGGISRGHFYEINLHKSDNIIKAINDNKVKTKNHLYKKWEQSDNATLQIALYKAICEQEERANLNQSNVDHTTKGEKITSVDLSHLSTDELKKLLDESK